MRVYQTNPDGIFIGDSTADPDPLRPNAYLIPGGCVATPPPDIDAGQHSRWADNGWLIETIPVAEPEPEPEPEPIPRADVIRSILDDLDQQAIRALRALAAGAADDADREHLATIEAQAQALRRELATLPPTPEPAPADEAAANS